MHSWKLSGDKVKTISQNENVPIMGLEVRKTQIMPEKKNLSESVIERTDENQLDRNDNLLQCENLRILASIDWIIR